MEWLTSQGDWVGSSESKGSEEGQKDEVDKEVPEVDVATIGLPLVVQQTGDQRMLQQVNLSRPNLGSKGLKKGGREIIWRESSNESREKAQMVKICQFLASLRGKRKQIH